VTGFPFEELEPLLNDMFEAGKNATKAGHDKIGEWIERVMYMAKFAYAVDAFAEMEWRHLEASNRAVDEDGNIVSGVSEKDEKLIDFLCVFERLLLRTFLRCPIGMDTSRLIDKIENISILIQATLEGKRDELMHILRCREAAEEFKTAEEEEG
jgi:hypothetical protein